MPISLPTSPTLNDTYTYNSKTWKWDGTKWVTITNYTNAPTGPTGPNSTIQMKSLYISPSLANGQGSYSVSIPANTYLSIKNDSFSQAAGDTSGPQGRPSVISLTSYENFKNVDVVTTTTTNSSISVKSMNPFVYLSQASTGVSTNSMIYGNNLYVVAGVSGNLLTSTDAVTWTTRTSGFGTSTINILTYGNGIYVAGGSGGTLTTSTDAVTWTTRTSGFASNVIYALTYGNGIYVAGGSGGALTTSTDAITWTARTSGTTNGINDILFANGIFLLGGQSGVIRSSTDGITWTDRFSQIWGTANVTAISYGNGRYVIGGGFGHIAVSTDAITWTISDTSNLPLHYNNTISIEYINGYFIQGDGNAYLMCSPDGTTWIGLYSGYSIYSIIYANGVVLAISGGGTLLRFNQLGSIVNNLTLSPISPSSVIIAT
jgi:hypothetical protein